MKPIKDYTVGEIMDVCSSHNNCCGCQLSVKDGCFFNRGDQTPEEWKLPPVKEQPYRRYDCSKTLDFVHEVSRRCSHTNCIDCDALTEGERPCKPWTISQLIIDAMQKWSDEHPEIPALTAVDVGFLGALNDVDYMYVGREDAYSLYLYNKDKKIMYLNNETFRFIGPGEKISISDLKEAANGKKEKEAGTP